MYYTTLKAPKMNKIKEILKYFFHKKLWPNF